MIFESLDRKTEKWIPTREKLERMCELSRKYKEERDYKLRNEIFGGFYQISNPVRKFNIDCPFGNVGHIRKKLTELEKATRLEF